MTFIQARNAIIRELSKHIKCPVRLYSQTQPENPIMPYIIYTVTTAYFPSRGLGSYNFVKVESDDNGDLIEKRMEQAEVVFSFTAYSVDRIVKQGRKEIQIYGEDEANETATEAQNWFIQSGYDFLNKLGFVVIEITNVADRSAPIIDEFSRRYGFDVRFRYCRCDTRKIYEIKKANIIKN